MYSCPNLFQGDVKGNTDFLKIYLAAYIAHLWSIKPQVESRNVKLT